MQMRHLLLTLHNQIRHRPQRIWHLFYETVSIWPPAALGLDNILRKPGTRCEVVGLSSRNGTKKWASQSLPTSCIHF